MKKFLWVIGCVLMLWGIPLSGQQSVAPEIPESAVRMTKVSGQVVDENTGDGLPLATISVTGLGWGTVCDMKGYFKVEVPVNQPAELTVRSVGYETKTLVLESDVTGNLVVRLKKSLLNLDEVTVTGTRTEKTVAETPVMTRIVPSEVLQRNDFESMIDVLEYNIPGLRFNTDPRGNNIQVQGLENSYILILVDGERLSTTPGGPIDFDRLTTANIKKIEVLKGAASALYGSSAMGMVINIITDDSRNKVNVTSNSRYGSKNQFLQSVNADVNVGKFGSYTSYQYQRADGWQLNPYTESKGELVPTNKQASEGFHRNVINQRFTYDATDRLSFYVRGTFFGRSSDRPMPMDKVNTTNYDMRKETFTYGAGAQYMINKNSYLNADYLSDNHSTYKDFFDGKKSGESDMTKRIHYHNLNVKGIFRLGKYNKLSAGAEFIKELLSSETDNIAGKSMYTTALYAQDEININEHFQAYAGLRYIYHENFKSYATPNVALLYKVGGFNFRGSYAAGFRTPELKELYTESEKKASGATRLTIGNPDLDPEKSDNFTLSAEYTMRYFSLSVSAFMNNVRSMINYKMLDTAERDAYNTAHGTYYDEIQMRANIDKAKIKGINVAFNSYLGAGFTLNGGYSFMDGKNVYEDEPLDKTVKHSGTVAAMWSHTWNKYKLNVNFNGRIQGERYSTSYGYAPKYSLWNLNTSHTFRAGDFLLEPGVGIENLFDYVDDRPFNYNYATLTPGRTYYVSLLVRFKQ